MALLRVVDKEAHLGRRVGRKMADDLWVGKLLEIGRQLEVHENVVLLELGGRGLEMIA